LWNNPPQVGARTHILLAAVLFGTTGTAQAAGPDVQPLAVGASRIVLGGALLALVAVAAAARAGGLRSGGGPRAVLLAGACVAVYQATFFAAVADTGVAVGTVVAIGSGPAFAGLFSSLFAGERLERRWAAATALACAGVGLLVLGGGSAGSVSAPGVGLALISGAGYAGYAVTSKRMLDAGGTPEAVMAAVFGMGALLMLPLLVLAPTGELATPGGVALVVYLGVVPTALAYVLFARGLEKVGASETATLTLAEPLTAAALGVIALGERPGLTAAAGAALVLAGLAALATGPSKRTATLGGLRGSALREHPSYGRS
jgi:DME family drug/metabolite transporter